MKISKKMKTALIILVVSIGVYLAFEYLLPFFIPFLIAYLGALVISPLVKFLNKRCKINRGFATIVVIAVFIGALGYGGMWLIKNLLQQIRNFIIKLPEYEVLIYEKIESFSGGMEKSFGLEDETILLFINKNLDILAKKLGDGLMPMLMNNSVTAMKWLIQGIAVTIIIIVAMVLITKDLEEIRIKKERFLFSKELNIITDKMSDTGGAYLRAQLCIMFVTTLVCVGGLMILKNPYALLVGVLIGIMDALPLFGIGIVFIPWTIIMLLTENFYQAAVLFSIYLMCYFLRQFLEPKIMGKRIGISSLEILISMYVGLRLFGIIGVFLGPVGYILIHEIVRKIA
ncbi:MAG: sporulation integral membrane protein YtvI [Clostridiales bacterium]|nr:sporulation integral membrane protein YtvI [Clostridiales bacterium]